MNLTVIKTYIYIFEYLFVESNSSVIDGDVGLKVVVRELNIKEKKVII